MRLRLDIDFAITGEGRFLSHHETMRLLARAAARAGLPIRYSEGFNPRRRISLPLPRPVGVAGLAERAIIELTDPIDPVDAHERLARQLPPGVDVIACRVSDRDAPRASAGTYRLEARGDEPAALRARIDQWGDAETWPIRRPARKRRRVDTELDLKTLAQIDFDGRAVTIRLRPRGDTWARPDEILEALALQPFDRARLVRTAIEWTCQTKDRPTESGQKD